MSYIGFRVSDFRSGVKSFRVKPGRGVIENNH